MEDDKKTKKQLIEELKDLRQCVAALKGFEEEIKQTRVNHEKFTKAFLQNSIPAAIVTLKDGRFVDVSDAFLRLIGRKRDEVVGHTSTGIGFITEEQRASFFNELNKRGRIENLEMDVRTKGGAVRHGLFNAVMMSINNEKYFLTVMTDITERKRAEEALRAIEENFRRSLDESPLGIRIATAEGETIYANREILDIHGYNSIEELKTTPVKKRYTPESYAEFKIRREKRKRGEYDPSEYEISIIRKDGEVRNLQVFRKEVLWGGDRQFQVIYQDITERKRAEQTLRLVTDNMSDMIRVTDFQGVNLYTSPSHFTVLGYKPEERVGKSAFDIVHPDDLEHVIKVFSDGLVNKKPAKLEYRIKHASGHYIWLETVGDFIRDDQGEVTAVIMSSRDITCRKQIEEALRKSQEQLRDANRLAHIGVWSWIADTDTVTWTEELYRIAGIDPMLPAPTYAEHPNIYTPESWNRLKVAVEKAIETGEHYQLELELIRPDGATRWVNAFGGATYDNHGRVTGLQGTVQDITERKRAEDALRESEEQYRLVANNIPDIIYSLNSEGNVVTVNSSAFESYGYSEQEAIGKPFIDFVHPDDREILINSFLKAIEDKRKVTAGLQLRIVAKNGVSHWFELNAKARFDSHDRYIGEDGVLRDITERRRAEEALNTVSRQLSSILESAGDVIAMMDTEYRYTLFNTAFHDEFARIFGVALKKGDSMPQALANLPEDLANAMEYWNRALDGEDFTVTQQFGDTKLGRSWYELHFSPVRDFSGSIAGAVHIVRNITERRRAEEKLRLTQFAIDNTSDAVFWTIPDARIVDVNEAACRLLGYTRDELLKFSVPDIDANYNTEKLSLYFAEIRKQGSLSIESFQKNKDGHLIPVEITTNFIQYDNKEFICAFVRDITERNRAETEKAEIEAQTRQLQKVESLGRMAGAIAHHFNNQIGAVIGNLEMAIDDLPPGAGPVSSLTAAMQAAGKAADVSGLMLTYLGQTPGKREPLDLSDVCLQNLPLLRTAIPNNVVLEADLSTPGPAISANANQIQQVLTNLLTNAWEAVGEDGGSIHLRVKAVSLTEIPIVHRNPIDWQPQDNAYACLEVTDTGCGIADKDIEKIFDPFFSSKFTGRGMGLAIVMGIVRAHGGAITVESEPGRGSAFRIFFPVSGEEVFRQPDKAAQPLATEVGGTVLLVEDEEMVRNMAAAMLNRLGFSVLEAKDGVEAVELFRQRQDEIRCVLTDLTMPRMNGWETLTALRKLAPGIPVILASGYDKAHVMAGDHPELPQVFLGKPYRLKGLSDAISQAMVRRK